MTGIRMISLKDLEFDTYFDSAGSKTELVRPFLSDPGTKYPLQVGVFTLEKSDRVVHFDYTFDEGKYIVEGEVTVTDTNTGESVDAKAGDILHIKDGTPTDWATSSRVVVFFVAGTPDPGGPPWMSERTTVAAESGR